MSTLLFVFWGFVTTRGCVTDQFGTDGTGCYESGEIGFVGHYGCPNEEMMKDHPGKRVLLDGFPRSIENAHNLVTLCGQPKLALHLNCDDTILMERIMGRGASSNNTPQHVRRVDDNFQSALQRLRTFHKYHHSTMEWLREQHVPIVNLDCSGSAESVWQQLVAIGRLMRPAVKIPIATVAATMVVSNTTKDTAVTSATTTTTNTTTVPSQQPQA